MTVNTADIVYVTWPRYTHYWLTGDLEFTCGSNPIALPPGSTVDDAAARFDLQIARLKDEADLKHFIGLPMPLDIARAADNRIQQILAEMTDIHDSLKALNLFGSTDDATEAAVNATANTRALAVRNALIAYRQHWIDNSFVTEQADAEADRAAWKAALINFASNNLGTLGWLV